MDSLKQHDVYKLVNISSVPKGEKIIGSRFVFKQKADGDSRPDSLFKATSKNLGSTTGGAMYQCAASEAYGPYSP